MEGKGIKGTDRGAGFATLPNQVHAEAVDAGFSLNVMVIGLKALCLHRLFLRRKWTWEIKSYKRYVYDRYLC